jgi:hypothetical protein
MSAPLMVYPAALGDQSSGDAANLNPSARARRASDDEILGLLPVPESSEIENFQSGGDLGGEIDSAPRSDGDLHGKNSPLKTFSEQGLPENLRRTLEENPELRTAWQDAQEYRKTFETPEAARRATALLADVDRMDALFFSPKPEDHAELARTVAALDPVAFASLAKAIAGLANHSQKGAAREADGPAQGRAPGETGQDRNAPREAEAPALQTQSGNQEAQLQFFHATNAAVVEGVLGAIESQVERLLPEGISKSARNRVVGEIYRELDATLRSNRQLA